jgi:hypothetical protein
LKTIAAAARQRQVYKPSRRGSGAARFFYEPSRRGSGAVAFFYKPSRRGSGSFSAAVDISDEHRFHHTQFNQRTLSNLSICYAILLTYFFILNKKQIDHNGSTV